MKERTDIGTECGKKVLSLLLNEKITSWKAVWVCNQVDMVLNLQFPWGLRNAASSDPNNGPPHCCFPLNSTCFEQKKQRVLQGKSDWPLFSKTLVAGEWKGRGCLSFMLCQEFDKHHLGTLYDIAEPEQIPFWTVTTLAKEKCHKRKHQWSKAKQILHPRSVAGLNAILY
jgi:hypothetical protein